MTMVDQKIEKENMDSAQSLENSLSALWEKAREASYLISTLRDEKHRLLSRIEELEEEIEHERSIIRAKEAEIEQLTVRVKADEQREAIAIDDAEKRLLQQKIRTAVAKLDQYLSSY
jgi:predicted  nucleic acid-binding Zn-ribbon protein